MALLLRLIENGEPVGTTRRDNEAVVPNVGDRIVVGSQGSREVLARTYRYGADTTVELTVGPAADDVRYTDPKVTWL